MTQYPQISKEERYTIHLDLKSGFSYREIARRLGRSPSTISREVARNTGKRGYRFEQAQRLAAERAYRKVSSLTLFALAYLNHLLELKWSPEQISGALSAKGWKGVPSHEWIYQYVYQDKTQGGTLHLNLRHKKRYRKRALSGQDRRGQIAGRQSIHLREEVINQRQRLGDFEGDTVIGKHHKGAILTLVDRKSLYVHIVPLGRHRKSANTINACIDKLKLSHAHSVTFDNGKEFALHERLSQQHIQVYFADAYRSNQRARNENTNGLIRQYLPKRTAIDKLTSVQTEKIANDLNKRPRKSLGWFTPDEVMAGFYTVALRS